MGPGPLGRRFGFFPMRSGALDPGHGALDPVLHVGQDVCGAAARRGNRRADHHPDRPGILAQAAPGPELPRVVGDRDHRSARALGE